MRTYIYYSKSKITDLDQQLPLPPWWRRILSRIRGVGVDLPVVGGAEVDIGPAEKEPVLRTMQKVWKQLSAEDQVGSFDDPKQYIYGILDFYYAFLDNVNPPLFFLVGATEHTTVALGGRKSNVRGFKDQRIRAIENAPSIVMEADVPMVLSQLPDTAATSPSMNPADTDLPQDAWAQGVAAMYGFSLLAQKPTARFEVLARVENRAEISNSSPMDAPANVLIGSPIFVAQA